MHKGDVVYQIRDWDERGTVDIRKLVVQSWGKEQGTATIAEDNQFLRIRFYTKLAIVFDGTWAENIFTFYHASILVPEAFAADLNTIALVFATKAIESKRAHIAERLQRFADDPNFCKSMHDELAKIHEPRIREVR